MPDKAFSELSKKEKLARARTARRKAQERIAGPSRVTTRKERASAMKAKKAAARVEKRLTGRYPRDEDLRLPGGTGSLAEGARGLMELVKKAVRLPGKARSRLEQVEEKTRGGR